MIVVAIEAHQQFSLLFYYFCISNQIESLFVLYVICKLSLIYFGHQDSYWTLISMLPMNFFFSIFTLCSFELWILKKSVFKIRGWLLRTDAHVCNYVIMILMPFDTIHGIFVYIYIIENDILLYTFSLTQYIFDFLVRVNYRIFNKYRNVVLFCHCMLS